MNTKGKGLTLSTFSFTMTKKGFIVEMKTLDG